uniref:Uncharacterized protein n=1 Tax=Arundo donax TaxID=35708 RepID=A0A0A9CQ62_ARUDO
MDKAYLQTWLRDKGFTSMHTTKGRHLFSAKCRYLTIEQILMRGMDQHKKRLRCLIRQRGKWRIFWPGQSRPLTILQAHLPLPSR